MSKTKPNKEEQEEAEDDTQMTEPDRPEGENLRGSEGENGLCSVAFKPAAIPPTKTGTKSLGLWTLLCRERCSLGDRTRHLASTIQLLVKTRQVLSLEFRRKKIKSWSPRPRTRKSTGALVSNTLPNPNPKSSRCRLESLGLWTLLCHK